MIIINKFWVVLWNKFHFSLWCVLHIKEKRLSLIHSMRMSNWLKFSTGNWRPEFHIAGKTDWQLGELSNNLCHVGGRVSPFTAIVYLSLSLYFHLYFFLSFSSFENFCTTSHEERFRFENLIGILPIFLFNRVSTHFRTFGLIVRIWTKLPIWSHIPKDDLLPSTWGRRSH